MIAPRTSKDSRATSSRWLGAGSSSAADAYAAGQAALDQAVRDADPRLLVVFCSDSYDLELLLAGIHSRLESTVPLIGCSTAGEISTAGPVDSSVVVTALGGDFRISTGVGMNASSDLRQAGAEAASCIFDLAPEDRRALLLLTDGLAGDQQEIVRGAYAEVGAAVPLVGGCAGDDMRMTSTHQLYGERVLQDAVVAATLGSDGPIGIGVRHGWRKVGEPMLVTSSDEDGVHQLDSRPALDIYLERLNPPAEVTSDPAAFTRFAMTHPLGIVRRSGEEVRFVNGADFESRSLSCIADVPQGGLTWFMSGDRESVLDATDSACREALEPFGAGAPLGMLAFDCIARRGVLGDDGIRLEVDRIAEHAGTGEVAGFYTYGEIARVRGMGGFHNQTLVVLAIG